MNLTVTGLLSAVTSPRRHKLPENWTVRFDAVIARGIACAYEHRIWILVPADLVPSRRRKWRWLNTWNRALPSSIVVHLSAARQLPQRPGSQPPT